MLDKIKGSDIIITGAITGALNPDSAKAIEHAERYYGLVREMKTDVALISKNTGLKESNICKVKNHLFLTKHNLGGEESEYFYPDYEIAQSWQRLISGKNIQPHDYILLKHEYAEQAYMSKGYMQDEAHELANKKYSYQNALRKRDEK